ncbi:hypothetical protein [Streptomyces sp. NPDC006267]|uniref:hypothetical protein n=1 Tax=unclassified Streptomyces TaxID=2593676 RepID=UPI0033AA532D
MLGLSMQAAQRLPACPPLHDPPLRRVGKAAQDLRQPPFDPGELFVADGQDPVGDEECAQMVGHVSVGHGVQALMCHRARRGRQRPEGSTAGRRLVHPPQNGAGIERAERVDDALEFGPHLAVGAGEDLAQTPVARAVRTHAPVEEAGDDSTAHAGLLRAGVLGPAGLAQPPTAGKERGDAVGLSAAVAR